MLAETLALIWPIFQPLAQVTVIDPDEGDSNLVDFCRLPLPTNSSLPQEKNDFIKHGWYRTLIDTGPRGADNKILKTLQHLAGALSLSKLDRIHKAMSTPLHALQVDD